MLNSELASSLAGVPDGVAESTGVQAGQMAAAAMLQDRSDDGATIDGSYTPSTDPGAWQPDPPTPGKKALGVPGGGVRRFVFQDAKGIRFPKPPAMTSQAY